MNSAYSLVPCYRHDWRGSGGLRRVVWPPNRRQRKPTHGNTGAYQPSGGEAAGVRPSEEAARTGGIPSASPVYSGIRVASACLIALILFALALFKSGSLYKCSAGGAVWLPRWIYSAANGSEPEDPAALPTAANRAAHGAEFNLMVLGLEAGQSLDVVFQETIRELRSPFPDLNGELTLVLLDISAGKSRADAFRNP